jgi:glycosyltransferase involved in cell wall biosynthesis
MKLIVNGVALRYLSRGARRYFDGVMEHLDWPGPQEVTWSPAWGLAARLSELARRGQRDAVFWSPAQRGPLAAANHVVTVLDCINVEYTYRGDLRLPAFRAMFGMVLQRASLVVAISQATRGAVLRNYRVDPSKVLVVAGPTAVALQRDGLLRAEHNPPTRGETPFAVMVVNTLPHKNSARALRAFAASRAARAGVELRVVGGADPAALAHCERVGARVRLHAGVSDDTLGQWLESALFLLSPSLDEGLNLPIAEALAQRCLVVCSDIAVHREFYDGVVMWFDPLDEASISQAIDGAVEQPLPRAARRLPANARGFAEVAADYRRQFMAVGGAASASAARDQEFV